MSSPANPDTGDKPGLVCFALLLPNSKEADRNLIWHDCGNRRSYSRLSGQRGYEQYHYSY